MIFRQNHLLRLSGNEVKIMEGGPSVFWAFFEKKKLFEAYTHKQFFY
jgi:hypothetical protein